MTSTAALVAVLRVCSTADSGVASAVIQVATAEGIDAPLLLAVAVVEGGVKGTNTLGLGRAALRRIGKSPRGRMLLAAEILRGALLACRARTACALALYHRGKTDSAEGQKYADKVLRLAAKIRRLARQEEAR